MEKFTQTSEGDRPDPSHTHAYFGFGNSAVSEGPDGWHTHVITDGEEFTSEDSSHIHRVIPRGAFMYEGTSVEDEIKQNVYDQQHPTVMTGELPVTEDELKEIHDELLKPIPGLTMRQVELIHNIDTAQPDQGEARKRRMEIIDRDMATCKRLLPGLAKIRAYLEEMPVDGDEDLAEAKRLADNKMKSLMKDVKAKYDSLQLELEIKQAI